MLGWFWKRHETEKHAAERADRLIRELGPGAYGEARRCEQEALDLETAADWRRVALIVAKRTGHKVGLDTATRMLESGD
jgi:hypothetical protein